MRSLLISLLLIILADLCLTFCANPKSPTGGAKDTVPPKLINAYPEDQQLRFRDNIIQLSFDERINVDQLKKNLIITPYSDIEYKVLPKKETVTLKFENNFDDSTTYTLNFFDGITDITEKNPVSNLILAFSTGNYIDSLYIYGFAQDLFFGDRIEDYTVGLYLINDTLDFSINKPTYFSTTTKDGSFQLQNIKMGKYLLFGFKDENRNLLFDPASEAYALVADTFNLSSSVEDSIVLNSVEIDASNLEHISARPSGLYFESRYSKTIVDFFNQTEDSVNLPSQIVGDENATIRFYPIDSYTDSIRSITTVYDSLRNQRVDTFYVKFQESSRKPTEFEYSLSTNTNNSYFPDSRFRIDFNKPVSRIDSSFLQLVFDTIFSVPIQPSYFQFNSHSTGCYFGLDIDAPQIANYLDQYLEDHAVDTSSADFDSLQFEINQKVRSLPRNKFSLQVTAGAFQSVEHDTTSVINSSYTFADPANYGTIKVAITTNDSSYQVQVLKNKTLVTSQRDCKDCHFDRLAPGEYWIRILIDSNNDNQWNIGNYQDFSEPEPAVYFKEPTTLRANWEVQLEYSF